VNVDVVIEVTAARVREQRLSGGSTCATITRKLSAPTLSSAAGFYCVSTRSLKYFYDRERLNARNSRITYLKIEEKHMFLNNLRISENAR